MKGKISQGSSSILVKGDDLKKGWESKFVKYLHDKNFSTWGVKGHYSFIDWIWVNLNSKQFAFGIPGVQIAEPLGNHAITIEEFKKIYEIYEKYSGLPLEMEVRK